MKVGKEREKKRGEEAGVSPLLRRRLTQCGVIVEYHPSPRIILLLKKQVTGPAFHQVEGILLWWLLSF